MKIKLKKKVKITIAIFILIISAFFLIYIFNKPKLELKGERVVTIECKGNYDELGLKDIDKNKVKIINNIDNTKLGKYKVVYTINKIFDYKVVREVIVKDTKKPKITLKDGTNITLIQGTDYKEFGYSAYDDCLGDISDKVKVSGTYDKEKIGEYEFTYTVSDGANTEKVVRKVYNVDKIVPKEEIPNTIYLTFDDGPSNTVTPKILDILKRKQIKATFFVIGTKHDDVLKRIYDEGHAIGLHSMTHRYNEIYVSNEAFYNDLNAISDKVYNVLGIRSRLFRFAGGGSNTVSRKYNRGIMSFLTKDVQEKGYHYFDWNVSSGDAGEAKNKNDVYRNVTNNLRKDRANIVLMHDSRNNYKTLDALEGIIDYGLKNGYQFLPMDMTTKPYHHKVNN